VSEESRCSALQLVDKEVVQNIISHPNYYVFLVPCILVLITILKDQNTFRIFKHLQLWLGCQLQIIMQWNKGRGSFILYSECAQNQLRGGTSKFKISAK